MIIFGTSILLAALLVYLIRFFPTNRKIRTRIQIGIIIAFIGYITFQILTIFSGNFRQHPFSASDANELLELHGFSLNDEFELTSKKISGTMDYVLEFELLVAKEDRDNIIDQIKQRVDEQGSFNPDVGGQLTSEFPGIDTTFYYAYEDPIAWNLEYYHKIPNGYIRTQDFIRILKTETKLTFERWE